MDSTVCVHDNGVSGPMLSPRFLRSRVIIVLVVYSMAVACPCIYHEQTSRTVPSARDDQRRALPPFPPLPGCSENNTEEEAGGEEEDGDEEEGGHT